jgi:hypothetical protein
LLIIFLIWLNVILAPESNNWRRRNPWTDAFPWCRPSQAVLASFAPSFLVAAESSASGYVVG